MSRHLNCPEDWEVRTAECRRQFSTAADALTAAIRTKTTDGGEIVSHLLATVAANLGGMHKLTEGRPGSWEAAGVDQLLASTVGPDGDCLLQYRTEPIEVVECVELAMVDLDIDIMYDESFSLIDAIEAEAANNGDKDAYDRLDCAGKLIDRLRASDYAAYCTAFERRVHDAAESMRSARHLPLDVPVSVRWVEWTGRTQTTGSQDAWGTVEHELWETAHSKTPFPGFTESLDGVSASPGNQLRAAGRMPHQRIPELAMYASTSAEPGVQ